HLALERLQLPPDCLTGLGYGNADATARRCALCGSRAGRGLHEAGNPINCLPIMGGGLGGRSFAPKLSRRSAETPICHDPTGRSARQVALANAIAQVMNDSVQRPFLRCSASASLG